MPHPAPLVVRLLGPLEVQVHGRQVRSGVGGCSQKAWWALALLALRVGREVSREWLAGTLWPESAPARALYNLRENLSDLRRALGDQAGRLGAPTRKSLRLDGAGAFIDAAEFDQELARGDAASLERAIALYRGRLLEGCFEEWVLQERAAREQSYLGALEQLAQRALGAGEPPEAIRHLRRALAADPLRESLHRRLMEALAAAGDYGAASEVYRELRGLLYRELNTSPSAETTAVFERLRAWAREKAARHERLPETCPRSTYFPARVPQPADALIGRDAELREVMGRLSSARLVTLTGAGGVGKTRLALAVARETQDGYADGACFVELAAVTEGEGVPEAVARALGIREEPGRSPVGMLVGCLERRSMLLVLDNCEHVIDASARLAAALLRACGELHILATSREALRIEGEAVWRVQSLKFPVSASVGADAGEGQRPMCEPPLEYPAVQLFVRRADAAGRQRPWTEEELAAVAEICRRLDGIPLAIELAAARSNVLSPPEIAARLDDRFRLLVVGSRTALPRHQTLRAALDWSWNLLPEGEQWLLAHLALFAGGCTLEAAASVCGCGPAPAHGSAYSPGTHPSPKHDDELLRLLTSLVEKSLVNVEPTHHGAAETRFVLLETVRQYGMARLQDYGVLRDAEAKHRQYYLDLLEHAPDRHSARWSRMLEREYGNLRAALESCLAQPALIEPALKAARALMGFWFASGYHWEARGWWMRVLDGHAAEARVPEELRAAALQVAGDLTRLQGDHEAAAAHYGEAVAVARRTEDWESLAGALLGLGVLARSQGRYDQAPALLSEARRAAELWPGSTFLPRIAIEEGHAAVDRGDWDRARAYAEESLALFRRLGDQAGEAGALHLLGRIVGDEQGDLARKRILLEDSLALHREVGNQLGVAWVLADLSRLTLAEGDVSRTRELLAESLRLRRRVRDRVGIANSLRWLAELEIESGNPAAARPFLEEGLVLRDELGDQSGVRVLRLYLDRLPHVENLTSIERKSTHRGPRSSSGIEPRPSPGRAGRHR
jgi:predicted ATPase/DNA-binding SARP family transcriptional activator